MSGGALTKEAKEMYLKEDIEHHRQRTLNNKNFIPKEKGLCTNSICKCGHKKYGHNLNENGTYGSCHIDDCECNKFISQLKDVGGEKK
jgi:hypothetical protein